MKYIKHMLHRYGSALWLFMFTLIGSQVLAVQDGLKNPNWVGPLSQWFPDPITHAVAWCALATILFILLFVTVDYFVKRRG